MQHILTHTHKHFALSGVYSLDSYTKHKLCSARHAPHACCHAILTCAHFSPASCPWRGLCQPPHTICNKQRLSNACHVILTSAHFSPASCPWRGLDQPPHTICNNQRLSNACCHAILTSAHFSPASCPWRGLDQPPSSAASPVPAGRVRK